MTLPSFQIEYYAECRIAAERIGQIWMQYQRDWIDSNRHLIAAQPPTSVNSVDEEFCYWLQFCTRQDLLSFGI